MEDAKLRILVVSQYFWPENMRINDLVEGFMKKGHEVTVLTSLPNYPVGKLFSEYKKKPSDYGFYKGAQIIRVPMFLRGTRRLMLALNYLSFFSSASTIGVVKLRKYKFDVIFVYAISPIMAAIPAIIIGRLKAAPVFLWVLDLWPETLSAVGAIKNNFIIRIIGRLVSWIYNHTDYILIQSQSFKSAVLEYCTRFISDKRLIYFPSWAEDAFSSITTASQFLQRDENLFTIMFAGNIGEAQDFPAIIDAFEKLKTYETIRLVIVGDGSMLCWVKNEVKARQLNNVILLGRYPVEKIPGLFFCADALLVSLKDNNIFSKTIPGKLQAYLASGKPVIGMINGEAADVIKLAGGLVGAAGDAYRLVENIKYLSELGRLDREKIGKQAIAFYNNHFSSKKLFDKLEMLFKSATLRRKNSHS